MLSPKAQAAANKIKNLHADDVRSLSEMVQGQVEHATEAVSAGLKGAGERLHDLADDASGRLSDAGSRARGAVRENPLSSGLIVLGLGILVGLILSGSASSRHHDWR